MKIYFEDGKLNRPNSIDFKYQYIVDAKYGITQNNALLNLIKLADNNASVYTNSPIALDNRFAWNDILQASEVYLARGDRFVRIDKLTDRKIHERHSIMKLYIAGEFNGQS